MRNIEGAQTVLGDKVRGSTRWPGSRDSTSSEPKKTLGSLSGARTQDNTTRQAAVGVLSLRRAPKLGKTARVLRLDLLFVRSPPPAEPKGARSAGPIGVRGSVSPTSLARQVGGVEIV